MTYLTHRQCMTGQHDRCPGRCRTGIFTTHKIGCMCECHGRSIYGIQIASMAPAGGAPPSDA